MTSNLQGCLTGLISTESAADLQTLTDLIEAGALTPALDRTYPLAQVPDALAYLRAGQPNGKLAITVAA
ncbi:zinc-binding dehydrogenase [Actinomadura welshii]